MGRAQNSDAGAPVGVSAEETQESSVGQRVRQLRIENNWSIRALAEASGLSANTLSLIENGKISPSVSTLHCAAQALGVSITAFFESAAPQQQVVFTAGATRSGQPFHHGVCEDLAVGFTGNGLHPCLVTLTPHHGSGPDSIVHTGFEFVYCLAGAITYTVDGQRYLLQPGDSLLFESHLPHRWQNEGNAPAQMLLVLAPTDDRDRPKHRHFAFADPAP